MEHLYQFPTEVMRNQNIECKVGFSFLLIISSFLPVAKIKLVSGFEKCNIKLKRLMHNCVMLVSVERSTFMTSAKNSQIT